MAAGNGNDAEPVAAIDLGSNSFHMVVGRILGDQLSVLDRLREPVRLAAGLDARGEIDAATMERMRASLERFGQRLRHTPASRVRAIGTNTFRKARRPRELLQAASDALGYPIEILSGPEEARLIYLGVSHDQAPIEGEGGGQRLVVDIGGGSTECIIGRRFTPICLDSLYMGCVDYSLHFFPEGKITRKAFQRAEIAAHLELETIRGRFRNTGWQDCVGSSGTINAIAHILAQETPSNEETVTLAGIKKLRKRLIVAGNVAMLDLPGLQPDRAPVLAGGLAILRAVFESLGIDVMRTTKAALREGVLYDLLGRIRHEDVRDRTIRALSDRYHVDVEQAARVETTALTWLDQVAEGWGIDRERGALLLGWAARTHELGLALAYSGYHKHGAYILSNSDMPGFSRGDQEQLATIVRGHRRKISRELVAAISPAEWQVQTLRLCVLLRLAVRINRTRSASPVPQASLLVPRPDRLEIAFPQGWLSKHPLTRADFEEEAEALRGAGIELRVH